MSEKFLCPLPWVSRSIDGDGRARLCCHENDYADSSQDFTFLRSIKEKMQRGEIPKECASCALNEKTTGNSPRHEYLQKFKNVDFSKDEASLRYLDFTVGNHCNLMCTMCTPDYSDRLVPLWKELQQSPHLDIEKAKEHGKSVDFPYANLLEENDLSAIELVTLTGGEPLMTGSRYDLLERLIKHGNPKKITLRYFSNLTIFPDEKILALWREFKAIELIGSVDAVGELYEEIRYPARWDRVSENIRKLAAGEFSYASEITLHFSLHVTVSAQNLSQLPDLISFIHSMPAGLNRKPSFTLIEVPKMLALNVLPRKHLQSALDKMHEAKKELALDDKCMLELEAAIKSAMTHNREEDFLLFSLYRNKVNRFRAGEK